jgi:alpha-tubulin suppressor-like RCC1 family protein
LSFDAIESVRGNDYPRRACVRSTDGRVACWGSNYEGELGTGVRNPGFTIEPIIWMLDVNDAAEIAAGDGVTCVRRTGGTVSCVGRDDYGQLGNGGVAMNETRLVDAIGVTDATSIDSSWYTTCVTRSSGRPLCWGAASTAPATTRCRRSWRCSR